MGMTTIRLPRVRVDSFPAIVIEVAIVVEDLRQSQILSWIRGFNENRESVPLVNALLIFVFIAFIDKGY